jgi:tRNA 5-methylaminomethyl-2-thiouridine biosynthesis bifunctional protein
METDQWQNTVSIFLPATRKEMTIPSPTPAPSSTTQAHVNAGGPPQAEWPPELEPALALGQALHALATAGPPAPGFYRLLFDQGRVLLTLCIGPRDASLAQLAMKADHIVADAKPAWTANQLHQLKAAARRGTTLVWADSSDTRCVSPALDASLWKPHKGGALVFDPAWALSKRRAAAVRTFEKPSLCTVIGSGISGALVARALALRGWQVTVLEQQGHAAGGASGLPAGLVSASGSSPADPLFALSRSAYHLTRHVLQTMVAQGEDWDEGGALRPLGRGERQSKNPKANAASTQSAPRLADVSAPSPWQALALWVKPQAWIQACMSTPGVSLRPSTAVHCLRFDAGHWQALDVRGQTLAHSELMVLCNAMDAARLLGKGSEVQTPWDPLSPAARRALAQMHPAYGSISSGPAASLPHRPALPVQGQGHFLPTVPSAQGLQWLAGAGFESDDSATDAACHQTNLARVAHLVPGLTAFLQAQFQTGQLGLWRGQRCVSHDRLPLVGPARSGGENGLWMCLAMGARGLTFAALCAELLAARLMDEPLPLPKRLARLLDVQRLQSRGR